MLYLYGRLTGKDVRGMYCYEMNVGYSVTDTALEMAVPGILDCFQDAAIFEAENSDITMDYLYSRHLAWLLSSWQIVIGRRPRLNERISIMTSPYAFKGFLGYRNFTLSTMDGEMLVKAASIWSLVDTQKLVPARPAPEMKAGYKIGEKLEMDYAPRKIALLAPGEAMGSFRVLRSQIDSNHHMNNVEYVRLAMEYLPEGRSVQELRVEYKKAAHLGDMLTAVVSEAGDKLQVQLRDEEGENYVVTEFTMKKPEGI